jgi:Fe2+ transport system protein FeoA
MGFAKNAERRLELNAARLDIGRPARVIELQGGSRATAKLNAMGIIPGAVIIKKSAAPLRGPVVLEKGAMTIAVGRDLAAKIIVQPMD